MAKSNQIEINTLIGRNSELNGDFTVTGSVRIDGIVNGNVTVSDTLIIGAGSAITGNISASACIIGGSVLGDINAPDKTELTETAKVVGNIVTTAIVIDEHAVFQGRCEMSEVKNDGKQRARTNKAIKAGRKSAKLAIAAAIKNVAIVTDDDAEDNYSDESFQ